MIEADTLQKVSSEKAPSLYTESSLGLEYTAGDVNLVAFMPMELDFSQRSREERAEFEYKVRRSMIEGLNENSIGDRLTEIGRRKLAREFLGDVAVAHNIGNPVEGIDPYDALDEMENLTPEQVHFWYGGIFYEQPEPFTGDRSSPDTAVAMGTAPLGALTVTKQEVEKPKFSWLKVAGGILVLTTVTSACKPYIIPISGDGTIQPTESELFPTDTPLLPTQTEEVTPSPKPSETPAATETATEVPKPFVEMTPQELFGKIVNNKLEGGLYPELHESYFYYDGTENAELKRFLLNQRLKLLQEHGKDISALDAPEKVRDAYLVLLKEINQDKEKGQYINAVLSPHEVHQYIGNMGKVRNGMVFEAPAKRGYKTSYGEDLGGYGGWGKLVPGVDYKGYYFNTYEGIAVLPTDKSAAEFYEISGNLVAVAYDFDEGGKGYIGLINTNSPTRVPNIVAVTFNRSGAKEFRAGQDYDERGGQAFSQRDAQGSSTLDVWGGTDISTVKRSKLNPPDLWEFIVQDAIVTTLMGTYKQFYAAGFPPEAAKKAQNPDDVLEIMHIARFVNVFPSQR